jgi:hypothetical protein
MEICPCCDNPVLTKKEKAVKEQLTVWADNFSISSVSDGKVLDKLALDVVFTDLVPYIVGAVELSNFYFEKS